MLMLNIICVGRLKESCHQSPQLLDDRQQRYLADLVTFTPSQYLADLVTFTPSQRKAADTNGDGNVTINDATRIQMYAAELIDHLG